MLWDDGGGGSGCMRIKPHNNINPIIVEQCDMEFMFS